MKAQKKGLTVAIFGMLLMLSGCFGATLNSDFDYLIYSSGGESRINVNGSDYVLGVGDKIEMENTTGTAPTCFYSYFTDNGIAVKAGYDPGSKKSDGTLKYPAWLHALLSLSEYKIRILKKDANPVEMVINYGEGGGIVSNSFPKMSTRNQAGKVSEIIAIDNYRDELGDGSQRGTVLDRTICFKEATDPLIFEVAALPLDFSHLVLVGDLVLLQEPITPPTEDEVKEQMAQDQGAGASTEKTPTSTGTTTTATSEKGGCGLHRKAPARTNWGVFGSLVWVPAVLGLLRFRKRA